MSQEMISKHFSLHEALYLPKWDREATEEDGLNDEVRANLKALFAKMDLIREHFNAPIIVHVAFRPEKYNALIGGAHGSAHMVGMAVDFHIQGYDCDTVRRKILQEDLLNKLELRMEDLPGSGWVHLDIRKPTGNRFFKP